MKGIFDKRKNLNASYMYLYVSRELNMDEIMPMVRDQIQISQQDYGILILVWDTSEREQFLSIFTTTVASQGRMLYMHRL